MSQKRKYACNVIELPDLFTEYYNNKHKKNLTKQQKAWNVAIGKYIEDKLRSSMQEWEQVWSELDELD